jgi:hypothetical protein
VRRVGALLEHFRVQHEPQRTERRVELAVLVLALVLLLQLAWFLLGILLPPSPEPIEPTDASLTVADRITGRLLDTGDSAELRDRPLFWAGRRPVDNSAAPVAEAPEEKASQLKGVRLLGIFGVGDVGGIIVRADGKQQRLAVGESLQGWTLESMDGTGATLVSATGGEERLTLERVHGARSVRAESPPVPDAKAPRRGPGPQPGDGADELTLGGRR